MMMMKRRGGDDGDEDGGDSDDDGTTLAALLPPLLLLLRFAFAAVAAVPMWVAVLVVSGVPGLAWSVAATVAPLGWPWPSVYKEV